MSKVIDLIEKGWEDKYSKDFSSEIRDNLILMDVFSLAHLKALNDGNIDVLASKANVHPNHVKKLLSDYNDDIVKQVEDNRSEMAREADDYEGESSEEFIRDTIKDMTKEEVVQEVTRKLTTMEESAIDMAKNRKHRKKKEK